MKNKRIDHINKIMSKHDNIFAENYIIFFKIQVKLEICPISNSTNFRRSPFGGDINVTYISQQPLPRILNNFIYSTHFMQ